MMRYVIRLLTASFVAMGLALLGFQVSPALASSDTLSVGQSLSAGQALWSADGRYEAVMQGDGNFVEYGPSGVVWNSRTSVAGSHIVMQTDGNLVIYPPSGAAVWSSSTAPSSNDRLVMQTDGNLVIYSQGGLPLWSSYGGSTGYSAYQLSAGQSLAAGQALWSTDGRYEAVMQGDGNFVEYGPSGVVWNSRTGGTGSSNRLVMQTDGNLVIYPPSGAAVWSSSTAPSSNDRLAVQTDGNLVIYSGSTALWAKGQLLTGPPGPYNAGIISHANAVPSGTYGGQCLVWVANIVAAAGGPHIAFGLNPATYQSQWAKIANQVSWSNVRPGDIVQFVTSSNEHTLIITGGNSPSTATVVDSNFGLNGLVSRGSFASRAAGFGNANYIIWRIHS